MPQETNSHNQIPEKTIKLTYTTVISSSTAIEQRLDRAFDVLFEVALSNLIKSSETK